MSTRFSVLVFSFLLFIDQVSKTAANLFLGEHGLINPICNSEIAWSIAIKPIIFYPLWIAVLLFLSRLLAKETQLVSKVGLILILSGGLSNMIDRVRYGCVVDFIDFKFWPVFNLADIFITLGVIIFAAHYIKGIRQAHT